MLVSTQSKKEIRYTFEWECKLVQLQWQDLWTFLKIVILQCDPAIMTPWYIFQGI